MESSYPGMNPNDFRNEVYGNIAETEQPMLLFDDRDTGRGDARADENLLVDPAITSLGATHSRNDGPDNPVGPNSSEQSENDDMLRSQQIDIGTFVEEGDDPGELNDQPLQEASYGVSNIGVCNHSSNAAGEAAGTSESAYPDYIPIFLSAADARNHLTRPRSQPKFSGLDDPTLPDVRANVQSYVGALYRAMINIDGVKDEPTSTGLKRFSTRFYQVEDIEARCWEITVGIQTQLPLLC